MEEDDDADLDAEFGTRVEEDLRTLANHLEEGAGDGTGDAEADDDGAIDGGLVTGMEIGGGICGGGGVGCGVDRSGVWCSSCIGDSANGTTLTRDGEACSRTGEVRSKSTPPIAFPTVTLRGLGVRE